MSEPSHRLLGGLLSSVLRTASLLITTSKQYLTSQSNSNGSALRNVRETELYGGVLSAALTREFLFLNAEYLRGDE